MLGADLDIARESMTTPSARCRSEEAKVMEFGKYHLVRKLATGGMAEIFLARQDGIEGFRKNIVLKRILPIHADNAELIDMFLDEARIAATLNHPNIVQIFDLGKVDGEFFIAMEYVHGQDLRRVCERGLAVGNFMPLRHAVRTIADAAAGLHYAHHQVDGQGEPLNIVHRDISPQNVVVSFDGVVKILDFGIAKAANKIVTTRTGQLKGKYAYMSPEQCNGLEVDSRSDIFSLGTLLYEITVCTRLFKGETDIQTIKNVSEAIVTPPSEVRPEFPRDLEAIVLKALARDPHHRYQTGRELQEALEDFLSNNRMKTGPVQLGNYMREIFPDKLDVPGEDASLSSGARESSRSGVLTPTGPTIALPDPGPAPELHEDLPSGAPSVNEVRSWTAGEGDAGPTAPMPTHKAAGELPRPARPAKAPEQVSFVVNENAPYQVNPAKVQDFKPKKQARKVARSSVKTVEYQLRGAKDDELDGYEKGSRVYYMILGVVVMGMLAFASYQLYKTGFTLASADTFVTPKEDPLKGIEAEPPPPELPLTLTSISSEPAGASVVINGILQTGETPGDFGVVPGKINSVSLYLAGHAPSHRNIAAPEEGKPTPLAMTLDAIDVEKLDPEADFGKLIIHSEPEGAAVILNGKATGQTPLTLDKLVARQEYHVVLRKQGHYDHVLIQYVYAGVENKAGVHKLVSRDRKASERITELHFELADAAIHLNDEFVGRAPYFKVVGRNEAVRVEFKLEGHHPYRRVFATSIGSATFAPALEAIRNEPGKLTLKINPRTTKVYLGSNEYESNEINNLEMPAGEYTVTMVTEAGARGEVVVNVDPEASRTYAIDFSGPTPTVKSAD